MAAQPRSDTADAPSSKQQTKAKAPPYRRWPHETQRDERLLSHDPEPLPWQRDWTDWVEGDHRVELTPTKRREYEAQGDSFDHHRSRSTAATRFDLSDAPDGDEAHFEILQSWNDGCRDSDRQSVEGELEKYVRIDSWGHRLELPPCVIWEAKVLMRDYDDLRRLGNYNGLHKAVLACLVEAYSRFWLRQRYRETPHDDSKRWSERDDFRQLWHSIDLTQNDLRTAAKEISRGTAV